MSFSTSKRRWWAPLVLAGAFHGCSLRQVMSDSSEQNQAPEQSLDQGAETMKKSIDSYTLSNGLQVFLVEKRSIPMATVLITARNGSFTESEQNNGLSHLYEHMFFKANERVPSQSLFMSELDEMGVELGPNMNAHTATEVVNYYFTIQSEYLERGLGFMADALIRPQFLKDELEKERKVVLEEFNRFESSPMQVFFQQKLMKQMFPAHFLRKNPIGSRPVIEKATRAQMIEIKDRYYIPNNTALFIAGDFPQAEIRAWVEKSFGSWKKGPDPFAIYPVPEHPPIEKNITFVDRANVNTVNVVVGQHGPCLTKDNRAVISFDVLSLMLGLETSKFRKELVNTGLATSASFFVWEQRYTSPLVMSFETSTDKAQAAYKKFMELRDQMASDTFFTEADFKTAKTSIEVTSAYDREVGQRFALHLADTWSSTGNLDYYFDYIDTMKSLTLDELKKNIQKYLFSAPYVVGALVPKDAPDLGIGVSSP